MKKLKVALIGLAHVHAQILYKDFNKYPDKIEWLGCADVPPYSEDGLKRRLELNMPNIDMPEIYDNYTDLLDKKPDIALIATDIKGHADIVEETLARDIHTVVEKPMATTFEEGVRMYRAQEKSKASLAINWPVAWFASFRLAYELTQKGAVGTPLRFQYRSPATLGPYTAYGLSDEERSKLWWYRHERGGGSIMDYAGYGCTLATWFLGKAAKRAGGFRKNFFLPFSDVEDYSTFTLDFEDAVAIVEGSWSTISSGEIPTGPIVYGTEGTLVTDRSANEVKVYRQHKAYVKVMPPDEVHSAEPVDDNIAINIINHINNRTPLHELITADFNLKALGALDAGIRSCASGNIEAVKAL